MKKFAPNFPICVSTRKLLTSAATNSQLNTNYLFFKRGFSRPKARYITVEYKKVDFGWGIYSGVQIHKI